MANVETPDDAATRRRLREVSSYYAAAAPKLSKRALRYLDSYLEKGLAGFVPVPPRLGEDSNLTGLAQLAALRTNTKSCFIYIIGAQTMHVIAEATQTISFFDHTVHGPGDELLLGVQNLPREYGLCSIILDAFTGIGTAALQQPTSEATKDHLRISDMTEEPYVRSKPIIHGLTNTSRYYASVPLRSSKGYVIGALSVLDPVARYDSGQDITILQEVARLVVQHLDQRRVAQDHRRAERLLEGLGHFIQGKSSLATWSEETRGQATIPNLVPSDTATDIQATAADLQVSRRRVRTGSRSTAGQTQGHVSGFTEASPRLPDSDGEFTTNAAATRPDPVDDRTTTSNTSISDFEIGYDPIPAVDIGSDRQSISLASISVRQVFSRASNLIREAMDLEATSFLEIPPNERFQSRRPCYASPVRRKGTKSRSSSRSVAESSGETSTTEDNASFTSHDEKEQDPQHNIDKDILCSRLGFATRTKSSLAGSDTTKRYMAISAKLLTDMTREYPQGHIFYFDALGNLSSSEDARDNEDPKEPVTKKRSSSVSRRLCRLFPTARSLIFLPLYDNDKQQVYAGFLGWTADATRALQKHEVTYARGFSNSIMAEVMRLEAVATDKAKSNFISSISHELRSPLHGVLAATQMLSEGKTYPHQAEFINMIDTCARTLLDIMEHLLSHAKINQFNVRNESQSRPLMSRQLSEAVTYSLVSDINLLSTIEETAASVAASRGQLLHQLVHVVQPDKNQVTAPPGSEAATVPILLEVTRREDWMIKSEAGSWRRIVMNLLGNAMKYTRNGHITISLSLKTKSKAKNKGLVELKVTDTGQGISEEYLRHRLYTPFAQEDNLSTGAGLGLSLVHQIVTSLRGKIRVSSEVGKGTEIVIQAPADLLDEVPGNPSWLPSAAGSSMFNITEQKSFATVGFGGPKPLSDDRDGSALAQIARSLTTMLTEWFEMKEAKEDSADIIVIEEQWLRNNIATYDIVSNKLLVFNLSGRTVMPGKIQRANCIFIFPPTGPQAMSQALKYLLENESTDNRLLQSETPDIISPVLTKRSASTPLPASSVNPPLRMPPERGAIVFKKESSTDLSSTITTSPGLPQRHMSVLLVDDNAINLRILVAIITKIQNTNPELGYLTASNGLEALNTYRSCLSAEPPNQIPLIFMDLSMPVMDGFEATRQIRSFESSSNVNKPTTIVALTGLASEQAMKEGESAGLNVHLRKPVSLAIVKQMMLRALE